MDAHPQLPLALDTAPAPSFKSFYVDEQIRIVRDATAAFVQEELDDSQLLLWGDEGVGKTHLLMAACAHMNARGFRIAYLPGETVNVPGSLEGLEGCALICLDDLQRLDHAAETALFHFFNRCREGGTRLLMASDRAPEELGLRLRDLYTRLTWGLIFQLQALNDTGLETALRKEIEFRSLHASDEVIAYVLRRFPRRISLLKQLVDRLDQVALAEQRGITVPLVKKVIGEADRISISELGRFPDPID